MLDEMFEWWLPNPAYDGVEKTAPVRNFLRRGTFAVTETGIGGVLVALGISAALHPSQIGLENTVWAPVTIGGGVAGAFATVGGLIRLVKSPFELAGDIAYNRQVSRGRRGR